VLVDHGRGGKIRDTWVTKGPGLRADTVQLLGPAQDQHTPTQRNESPGWPPGIH